MNLRRRRVDLLRLLLVFLSLQLLACTSPEDEPLISDSQKYYFVEALKDVL